MEQDSHSPANTSGARTPTAALFGARSLTIALWLAVLGAFYAFLLTMVRYEPITGDGWFNVSAFGRQPDLFKLIKRLIRLHETGNPRFGQFFTMLTYRYEAFHLGVTPLVLLSLLILVFVHAMGRLPRLDSRRDLSLFLTGTALCWLAVPTPGQAFFYRPITTNYVYTLMFSLLLLLPFRLGRPLRLGAPAIAFALVVFPLSGLVGMMNEHTGPTWIAVAAVCTLLAFRRRDFGNACWMTSASVGLLWGYLVLFFAPGQERRYGKLGQQSVIETIEKRGLLGNLQLADRFCEFVGPALLLLLVIAVVFAVTRRDETREPSDTRGRLWVVGGYVLLAAMIVGTAFAAPKNHYRLFIGPAVLLAIAGVAAVDVMLRGRAVQIVVWLTSAAVNLAFVAILLDVYQEIHEEDSARVAAIMAAKAGPPGQVVRLQRMSTYRFGPLFYGDSAYIAETYRGYMARYYGLAKGQIQRDPIKVSPKKDKKAKRKKAKKVKVPEPPPDAEDDVVGPVNDNDEQ